MERCIVYIFIVIVIVYYFVQETSSHIEQFEEENEYKKLRYNLLSCRKFDCMYNKEIACENWCNKLKSEFSKESCLSKCFNYTDSLINYAKHQEAIFGGAIYDFNPPSDIDFITSIMNRINK